MRVSPALAMSARRRSQSVFPGGDHDVFGGWSLVPGNLLAHRLSSSCEKQTRVRHGHSTRRDRDDPRRQDRRSRRDLPRRIVSGEAQHDHFYVFH